jgi:cellulose biosynthesis protein BcsQ
VLIDTSPTLNALTRTAWAASDRVAIVTEPGLFSVAAADRGLRAIEEIRRGLSPRLQPLGVVVNRVRSQSVEHQFRVNELRSMFGPLVMSPLLPERTSLQQAQGAARPVHAWPGEASAEMASYFEQLLERVLRIARIGETRHPVVTQSTEFANPGVTYPGQVVQDTSFPGSVAVPTQTYNDPNGQTFDGIFATS